MSDRTKAMQGMLSPESQESIAELRRRDAIAEEWERRALAEEIINALAQARKQAQQRQGGRNKKGKRKRSERTVEAFRADVRARMAKYPARGRTDACKHLGPLRKYRISLSTALRWTENL